MIVSTALAILLTSSPRLQWGIAAHARFYYPEGDRRISHYRNYLLTLDGKRKKLIGSMDANGFVSWRDRNRLVWSERRKRTLKLFEMNVDSGATRTLCEWEEGVPDPPRWYSNAPPQYRAWVEKASARPLASGYELDGEGRKFWIRKGTKRVRIQNQSISWPASYGFEGLEKLTLEYSSPPRSLDNYGSSRGWRLLGADCGLTAHEAIVFLFRMNEKTGKAWLIPADVVWISALLKRDKWVGISDRSLNAYAEPDVWVNALTVGKISGGKSKVIWSGRVMFHDAELRP